MTDDEVAAEMLREIQMARQLGEAKQYDAATEMLHRSLFRGLLNPGAVKILNPEPTPETKRPAPADTPFLRRRIERMEAIQRCEGWEAVAACAPPKVCIDLFNWLNIAPWAYEEGRSKMRRLTHESAAEPAKELRRELRASDGTPGLTQAERKTLLELLGKQIEGGKAELTVNGKAMPLRPGRDTAPRTFIVRGIHLALSGYPIESLPVVIAELAHAALGYHVSPRYVRDALKNWEETINRGFPVRLVSPPYQVLGSTRCKFSASLNARGEPKLTQLPETGFLRLRQILGDPNAEPPLPPIIPVGKSAWWAGVRSGRYPAAIKLGPRTTAWSVESIRRLIDETSNAKP